jgi:hypothetical protein
MRKPTFFLIGAPKCGTSALAHYLGEHPQVAFSAPKEPYYWADDFPGIQERFGISTLSKYEQLFQDVPPKVVAAGEGSTIYLASTCAVERILNYQPEAKFIAMLRNPVELASSLHLQQISQLNEDEYSFRTAWHLQEERSRNSQLPRDCFEPRLLQYRQIATLGFQVDELFRKVARDRIHFIFYDDFQKKVLECYRDTLRFLDASSDNRTEFPRINEGKLPRFKWLSGILNGRTGTKVSRFLKRNLKGNFRTFADGTKRLLTTKPHTREALPDELRRQIQQEFRQDIKLLSDRTGRDLMHWLI